MATPSESSPFTVEIPKKLRPVFRARYFENPFAIQHPSLMRKALDVWRRIALVFDERVQNMDQVSDFRDVEPFEVLSRVFGISPKASVAEYASLVAPEIGRLNDGNPSKVRKRIQLVNAIHCNAQHMTVVLGQPEMDKYRKFEFLETYDKNNKPYNVAKIKQATGDVWRGGEASFESYKGVDLHPLAKNLSKYLYGPRNVKFDHVESGSWGVRAGILPWNTRAMNLGAPLAQIFARYIHKYENPSFGLYTDEYGRITTFYGWILSSTELCQPDILGKLVEILKDPAHHECQVIAANDQAVRFMQEVRCHNVTTTNYKVLGLLFFWYLMLTVGEWEQHIGRFLGTCSLPEIALQAMESTKDDPLIRAFGLGRKYQDREALPLQL